MLVLNFSLTHASELFFEETVIAPLSEDLEVGDINYGATCSTAKGAARVWPMAQHVKFCMDTAPKLYRVMVKNTSWNDQAIKLSLGWTLAESGWNHSLRKPNNFCFWGFMKNEVTLPCSAKTMEEGFLTWKNYLSDAHEPPDHYVKFRAKSCAPHRALIKNFNKDRVSRMWSDDELNLWMRSQPYVKKTAKFYNSKNPGEIKTGSNGKEIIGEAPCTYNSVNPNYAAHVKLSTNLMVRYCKQIYDDITSDDDNGVHRYMHKKKDYAKVKDLLNYQKVSENQDFYQFLELF